MLTTSDSGKTSEERTSDEASQCRLTITIWPSLLLQNQKVSSFSFSLLILISAEEPHTVGCYDCVTYCDIPMDLQTKQLLSQHVSSETEAITNSKQNAWLGLGRERKSLGFKQKFGPNPKVTVSF